MGQRLFGANWYTGPNNSDHNGKAFFSDDLSDDVQYALFDMISSYTNSENDGSLVNDALAEFLDGTHCQSALSEIVFISNQTQCLQAQTYSFQDDAAYGLYSGLYEHFYGLSFLDGDLNNDQDINVSDIVILLDIILDSMDPLFYHEIVADVNNDYYVDILDVVMMVNTILYGSYSNEYAEETVLINKIVE